MRSDWRKEKVPNLNNNFILYSDGVCDCMGETMAQTHIRAHRAGIKIEDIHGYRNMDLGGGPVG